MHSIPAPSRFSCTTFWVKRATPITRLAGAARFAIRASVGPILPPTPRMRMSPSARARSASSSLVGRVMASSSAATSAKPLILRAACPAPGFLPVVAEEVGLAPVGAVETVRNLEHRKHEAALRSRPGLVAAARRAPYELALLAFALATEQAAFEHVRLLDLDMLVIGQARARRHLHEERQQAALALDEQSLGLDARIAGLLPRQTLDVDEAGGKRRQVRLGHDGSSVYGLRCSPTLTIFIVLVPPALPIGSPMVRTIRSPAFTTLFSPIAFSASRSSSSRSCPMYFTISG